MELKGKDQRPGDGVSRHAFQFVQITSPLKRRPPDVERTVRTHVTSRYHEQQRVLKRLSRSSEPIAPKPEGFAGVDEDDVPEPKPLVSICPTCKQSIQSQNLLSHSPIGRMALGVEALVARPKHCQDDDDVQGSQTLSAQNTTGYGRRQLPLSPKTSGRQSLKRLKGSASVTSSQDSTPGGKQYLSQDIDSYFPMADTRSIANPSYRNPFDVEAWAAVSADMYQVVERFISQYYESSHLSRNPLRNTVMPAAMRFVGLFLSQLFSSLLTTAVINRQDPGEMVFVHKGYVIRAINESLGDEKKCCTDEVITTVASLINEECIYGNVDKAEIHFQGLERMVDLRGGIDCLGFKGDLKQVIIAYDYALCVLASSLPYRFTNPESIGIMEDSIDELARLADFRCFTLQEYFTGPEALDGISLEVLNLLDYLHQLAWIYKLWNETDLAAYVDPELASVSNRDALAARWSSIRSSLLDFPSADSPVSHPAINDYVYESLRFAIVILSQKGIPAINPTYNTASTTQFFEEDARNLQNALEKTKLLEFWGPLPGAVLWCFAIGANVCQKSKLKSWFSAHLIRTLTTYMVFRKKELDESIRMILHGLRELQVPD